MIKTTRKDIGGLLALLESEYPNSFSRMTNETRTAKLGLWADEFRMDDSNLVYAAVRLLMKSSREFAPNIGQIRDKMRQLTEPESLTETQAWALVSKACKNGIYGAQKEFDALPETIQLTIGSPSKLHEWAMMDEDTLESVVMSAFVRSYRVGVQRAQERRDIASLPQNMRDMLAGTIKPVGLIESG